MIKSRSALFTDHRGQELQEEGLQLFDLTVNSGDIHQFIAGHIPSHWHRELELFVLLEGRVQVGVGDTTLALESGEGCFINTGVIHFFTADIAGPCMYRSFVFSPDIVGGIPGGIFDTTYVRPILENGVPFLRFREETGDRLYFEQFQRAFAACEEENYGYEFQVRDALSHILLHIKSKSNVISERAAASVPVKRLKEMLAWIHKNLNKAISVSDIADSAHICPRECQRIFRQYLHYSPIEYVQRKRIFMAAEQLSVTDCPITDIALNCGFSSPSYFSRQFKALVGSTPRGYRIAVRKTRP